MIDTLPKLPNELPNTDEPERVAATLIAQCQARRRQDSTIEVVATSTHLKPVWVVDFYRGRPAERSLT